MLIIDTDWIAAARDWRYRRTPERRVQSIEAAEAFIREAGFAFLWPIQGAELPSLFQAIAGQERDVPMAHDDPDNGLCWSWKDQSLGGRRWYYAKLLRRKATLVAPALWGHFYALTRNYGDLHDYLEQVSDGIMTHEARLIYEALLNEGPLGTVALRKAVGMAASASKTRFERGLVALQGDMKALPVGVAEEGAWRYSFIYDIPLRRYPELAEAARALKTSTVWQTLVGAYVDAVIATTTRQIAQMFHVYEPTAGELERALATLVAAGRIAAARIGEGGAEVWVSRRALDTRGALQA